MGFQLGGDAYQSAPQSPQPPQQQSASQFAAAHSDQHYEYSLNTTGETVQLDISAPSTTAFNPIAVFMTRVMFDGKIGRVIGSYTREDGTYLGVHLDGEAGATLLDAAQAARLVSAPEEALPPPADEGYANADLHKLRVILSPFTGEPVSIVLQNINGPCPLVALANALALRGAIAMPKDSTSIHVDELVDLVSAVVVCKVLAASAEGPSTSSPPASAVAEAIELGSDTEPITLTEVKPLLRGISAGLDVNVSLCSPVVVYPRKHLALFEVLAVPVLHSWLPELNSDAARGVAALPSPLYDDVVISLLPADDAAAAEPCSSSVAAVKDFIDANPGQATLAGLLAVKEQLPDGALAVFFRANHFSTIIRRGEDLFTLATDIGFAAEDARVCGEYPSNTWESLNTTKDLMGASDYFDGAFVPAAEAMKRNCIDTALRFHHKEFDWATLSNFYDALAAVAPHSEIRPGALLKFAQDNTAPVQGNAAAAAAAGSFLPSSGLPADANPSDASQASQMAAASNAAAQAALQAVNVSQATGPANFDQAYAQLTAMGYSPEEVRFAVSATNGDINQALDILTST